MSLLDTLAPLRAHGHARTPGLDDATVLDFAGRDADLVAAINAAAAEYQKVRAEFPALLDMDEDAQAAEVQSGFVNFYSQDAANPYVALAARGPWIVTLKGAVIYDTGGYGMLGLGHAPEAVIEAMAKPQAMANIMTPNVSQLRFANAMRNEIGQARGGCPYAAFLCLNSGSESVSLAARIVDANAKTQTDPGARHAGRTIKRIVVKGAFHGRTERPALYSDSSRKAYVQHLASFRGEDSVIAVPAYDHD
ncbi:MAG: aminotransferase class III-fold pyridoxal phosphate-dependent enzyme, partial [Thermomonas sp.]